MEMKRWGLIYSGLCLALVFSVSPVEAQNNCEKCQRCDRDGDGLIKQSGICKKQCDPTMSMPDPNDNDADGNCPVDDENFISLFEVTLTGPVTSTPDPANWVGATSGGKTINLPVFNPLNMSLDLSFFADMGNSMNCFPEAGSTRLFAASIQSKKVGGMDDPQAIGMFWFNGKTNDGLIDVGYVLQVLGTFSAPNDWPELFDLTDDTNTLTMTDWKMQVESTKKGGRKKACISEGNFFDNTNPDKNVVIPVIQTQ